MKGILIWLPLFLAPLAIFSQNKITEKAFDSLYYHITVTESFSNPKRAMYMADSLFNTATSDQQRVKSLMLKGNILEKQEKRGEAIHQALKGLKIAKKGKHYNLQARIYGFLSIQYRMIGFLDEGKESIKNGLAISNKIGNEEDITKYTAMAYEELAEYAMEEKEYDKAIEYLQSSRSNFLKLENNDFKIFQLANVEEMIGRVHIKLDNAAEALKHFSKANMYINKADAGNTIWAALIYQGYADVLLRNKNPDSARVYLNKAMLISENGTNNTLKESVYESAAEYYNFIKKADSFAKYDSKFRAIQKENIAKNKNIINHAYNALRKESKEKKLDIEPEEDKTFLFLAIGTGAILLITAIAYFYKRKQINASKEPVEEVQASLEVTDKPAYQLSLPSKTREEILKNLEEFEASGQFLEKEISFSALASKTNTNARYLREVLRTDKQKDYTSYINDLRINYIVNKLETDSKYLNYKISYLADETGFSSHSKFSESFKRLKNISPSEYIERLQNAS